MHHPIKTLPVLVGLGLFLSAPRATVAEPRAGATSSKKSLAALLVGGTWVRHLDTVRFRADGTYRATERNDNPPTRGTWRLDGQTLIQREGGETTRHRIISLDKRELKLTFGDGSEGLEYTRE